MEVTKSPSGLASAPSEQWLHVARLS